MLHAFLAQEHGICEVAIVADFDLSLLAQGEMHAIHRAVISNHESRIAQRYETA